MTPLTLLLVTGLLAQTPAPAAPPQRTPLAEAYFLFLQGRTLEGTGDTAGAIAAYRKALELSPRAAEIRAQLASVYAGENQLAAALAEATEAVTLEPTNREANRLLGFLRSAEADGLRDEAAQTAGMKQAIAHFERVVSRDVSDPAVDFTLGRLYVMTGNFPKGIERLQIFLHDQPDYPDALLLLAAAYEESGRPADAVGALESLARLQPNQLPVRARLAELYEEAGRWADAATLWGDLARRSRQPLSYRGREVAALVNAGNLPAAREQLATLTAASPGDANLWYLRSQVERRLGDTAAAEAAAAKIAEINPADPRAALALGAARVAKRDFRGAIDVLQPRVTAATDEDVATGVFAILVSDLSAAIERSGDRTRAIRAVETARTRAPADEGLRYTLAALYERDRKFDQAEGLYRDVLTREPGNASAMNSLGYLLADAGRKLPEALTLAQQAVALEPDNPSYLDTLGWTFFKLGRLEDARAPLERSAAASPRSSVIQEHLGDLYLALKRYDDASAAFGRALAGDHAEVDTEALSRKRDRAKALAGGK